MCDLYIELKYNIKMIGGLMIWYKIKLLNMNDVGLVET